ncbi:hypothetical protein PENARI_c005G07503 [Penicillium arizonense]|uniref:Uncharacterized protein n=1 Tax=Penicillium arizonense TaxID=1835702 RepID=A0A1F5LP15_PENAI|nr:hypothetical protein PENARI_c005G07503 [Penicillium arizonense]OGE54857.1 hypothetical protein PENARI_c005G07503 [Penicillium arizonense]
MSPRVYRAKTGLVQFIFTLTKVFRRMAVEAVADNFETIISGFIARLCKNSSENLGEPSLRSQTLS